MAYVGADDAEVETKTFETVDLQRDLPLDADLIEPDPVVNAEVMRGKVAFANRDCSPRIGWALGIKDDGFESSARRERIVDRENFQSNSRMVQANVAHLLRMWPKGPSDSESICSAPILMASHNRREELFRVMFAGDPARPANRYEDFAESAAWLGNDAHRYMPGLYGSVSPIDCSKLSQIEIEILRRVAEGRRLDQAASEIGVSIDVAVSLLESARRKLQARNVSHAVAKAMRAGPF